MANPRRLRAPELQARLQQGEPLQLVDVREPQELELAALDQPVIHLPLSRSQDWIDQIPELLDRQRPVVVLCHAGSRSALATQQLMKGGVAQVANLRGGLSRWSDEGFPMEGEGPR